MDDMIERSSDVLVGTWWWIYTSLTIVTVPRNF
jgi:hypothetical protein